MSSKVESSTMTRWPTSTARSRHTSGLKKRRSSRHWRESSRSNCSLQLRCTGPALPRNRPREKPGIGPEFRNSLSAGTGIRFAIDAFHELYAVTTPDGRFPIAQAGAVLTQDRQAYALAEHNHIVLDPGCPFSEFFSEGEVSHTPFIDSSGKNRSKDSHDLLRALRGLHPQPSSVRYRKGNRSTMYIRRGPKRCRPPNHAQASERFSGP